MLRVCCAVDACGSVVEAALVGMMDGCLCVCGVDGEWMTVVGWAANCTAPACALAAQPILLAVMTLQLMLFLSWCHN
jgi:hypothetical protein